MADEVKKLNLVEQKPKPNADGRNHPSQRPIESEK